MVIKLDFRKAFDSVSRTSLLSVLDARCLPPLFCSWIQNILNTLHYSSMECLDHEFNAKNGLRQGAPISPYLYIISQMSYTNY
jgi:hypothetical protein